MKSNLIYFLNYLLHYFLHQTRTYRYKNIDYIKIAGINKTITFTRIQDYSISEMSNCHNVKFFLNIFFNKLKKKRILPSWLYYLILHGTAVPLFFS